VSNDLRSLRTQVQLRLQEITPALAVGVGRVPDGVAVQGRLTKPYAVVYASAGMLQAEGYSGSPQLRQWGCQITVGSGSEDATLFYVQRVRDALTGVRLEPDNRAAGQLNEVGDPGPVRRDDENLADVRWWLPLLFTHYTNRSHA
jgi:hypothetical protein